jgi:hypothetical protein
MWQGVCSFGLPNNKRLAPVTASISVCQSGNVFKGFVLLVLRFVLSC